MSRNRLRRLHWGKTRRTHSDIIMTTGTYVRDLRVNTTRLLQTNSSGPAASGSFLTGMYRSKTWNGSNSPTPVKPQPGRVHIYTVPTKNGGFKTRKWVERPIRNRAKFRDPQPYTMSYNDAFQPKGSFYVGTTTIATGALTWSRYTECSAQGWGALIQPPTLPTWTANDDIKLIGKLQEAVRGSDFNPAVFLGEANQTLRLIGDTAIKVARAYSLFRKGDVISAANTLMAGRRYPPKTVRAKAGSSWLELQYGWLPLLGDMKSGAELLAHQLSVPFRKSYRVRHKIKVVEPNPGPDLYYAWADRHAFVSKQIIAYISEPPSVAQLSGILDPELVAWELVPFSFVADWVMPIGDYLSARAFAGRLSGLFVTTTITRRHISGMKPRPLTLGPTRYDAVINDGGYYQTIGTMDRSLSSVLNVPRPVVKPWSKIASWQHCANALALLSVTVTGKKT